MKFDGFDWDAGNAAKCQKHGLSIAEIESVFLSQPRVAPDVVHSKVEQRFRAVGRSTSGRHVFAVFALRRRSGELLVRPCTPRRSPPMSKKKFPEYKTDAEAEHFVATVDLSEFDFSDMKPMRFELRRKDKTVSLRLPEPLLDAVRQRAKRAGMPYQRFIRMAVERALHELK